QEDPKGEAAHRTSPTNIGFYLISCLAAHDLGYLSLPALLDRLEKACDTFDQLERFHGHFYNWYNTQTLHPLQPGYVSTVDSGNLLACLLALKQGLRGMAEEIFPAPAFRDGLRDTLALALEELQSIEPPQEAEPLQVFRALDRLLQEAGTQLEALPADLPGWYAWLGLMEQR